MEAENSNPNNHKENIFNGNHFVENHLDSIHKETRITIQKLGADTSESSNCNSPTKQNSNGTKSQRDSSQKSVRMISLKSKPEESKSLRRLSMNEIKIVKQTGQGSATKKTDESKENQTDH